MTEPQGKIPTAETIAALDRGLDSIAANPTEWTQSRWICGTGGCLAYHVVVANGGQVERDPIFNNLPVRVLNPDGTEQQLDPWGNPIEDFSGTADGAPDTDMLIPAVAQRILGMDFAGDLTEDEGLFAATNSWDDLLDIRNRWAAELGLPYRDPYPAEV